VVWGFAGLLLVGIFQGRLAESISLGAGKRECVGEQPYCRLARASGPARLKVSDATYAHARADGQVLLGHTKPLTVCPHLRAEHPSLSIAADRYRTHGPMGKVPVNLPFCDPTLRCADADRA
jgi:hypothetical protein